MSNPTERKSGFYRVHYGFTDKWIIAKRANNEWFIPGLQFDTHFVMDDSKFIEINETPISPDPSKHRQELVELLTKFWEEAQIWHPNQTVEETAEQFLTQYKPE